MPKKIRIAFIKFAGLSAGGTERWLQMMAVNLPKDRFAIDYYYCDAAPYTDSSYRHADTNEERLKYLRDNGINLIKFTVEEKDVTKPNFPWKNSNFFDLFDHKKYDYIQTAKAGPREYPYYLLPLPVVEYLTLNAGVDFSANIRFSIHPSEFQRELWIKRGGSRARSSVIYIPSLPPASHDNLRAELGIPENAVVAGFHQRNDDNIMSTIPLAAFSTLHGTNWYFVIMGGSQKYREQAKTLGLTNVLFLDHGADPVRISKFLNTLDIFAHGRRDGEFFGAAIAEAMMHGLPCMSHWSDVGANAQPETMGEGGFFVMNETEYAEKLNILFSNETLRKQMGQKAKKRAEHTYTVEQCAKQLIHTYEQLEAESQLKKSILSTWKRLKAYAYYQDSLLALCFRSLLFPELFIEKIKLRFWQS